MTWVTVWESVTSFIEAGGQVLGAIFIVTLMMWTLMVERVVYAVTAHLPYVRRLRRQWQARTDRRSWRAGRIRELWISEAHHRMSQGLPLIKTLVALCPLLGLLGTVTGMIEVFDVMAVAGNGNPRAMASGVSRATIPTMAGMVAAISGMIFSVQLDRYAARQRHRLEHDLVEE